MAAGMFAVTDALVSMVTAGVRINPITTTMMPMVHRIAIFVRKPMTRRMTPRMIMAYPATPPHRQKSEGPS